MNFAIQGRPASIAGFIAVVAMGMVILSAPSRHTPSAIASVTLAVVVASNLVLRASDWVIGPTLVAAGAMLGLAVVDQLTSIRLGTLAGAGSAALEGISGSVRHLAGPVVSRLGPANDERVAIARGLAVALAVGVLLTTLLANADAALGQILGATLSSSVWTHLVLTAVLTPILASISATSHVRVVPTAAGWVPTVRPVEAVMGLGAMVVVLSCWAAVQVTIAAGGADRLLAAADVTRAEHAREGFFEMVVVVAVVLGLLSLFGRLLGDDVSVGAVALLVSTGVLTIVLVAVSFSRLSLYIEAFGLTMLRLSVAWFLGWLAILVVAVAAWSCGVARRRSWLATLVLVSATLTVTAFGWSNPEATVAVTNLRRDNAVVALDVDHLATLGPDAATVLLDNGITPGVDCTTEVHPYGPLGWNRSWATACRTGG